MQIHELNRRKPLNELDIAGPGGLVAGAKAALGALRQTGGAKDLGRTVTPGQGQGLTSTADLTQSDFAKRMQAVKNQAAIKQVAANLQQQWKQVSKTLPAATTTAPGPNAEPETTTPLPPTTSPSPASPSSRSRLASKAAAYKATRKESVQLDEAASLGQLTDWYKQSVIPKSMAAASAKYLANPVIKTALNKIVATADNPVEQSKAFEDLVAATSVVSQTISAENPQLAAAGATRAATSSPATQATKTNIAQAAGMTPSQMDAIKKITSALGPVSSRDPATVNSLRALGFNVQ
jgi:hypothetical protein